MPTRRPYRTTVLALSFAIAAGCASGGGGGDGGGATGDAGVETAAVEEEVGGAGEAGGEVGPAAHEEEGPFVLPVTCELPNGVVLGADPVRMTGTTSQLVAIAPHMYDAATDPERGLVFFSGIPGTIVIDVTGDEPVYVSHFPGTPFVTPPFTTPTKYDRVDLVEGTGGTVLAVTYAGMPFGTVFDFEPKAIEGLTTIDVSNPAAPKLLGVVPMEDLGPVKGRGDRLYVGRHDGTLLTFDLSDPAAPEPIHVSGGLKNPREIELSEEHGEVGYVADAVRGLAVLDLLDADAPQVVETAKTAGPGIHLDVEGELAAVALGSAGVELFSLADPWKPVSLGVTSIFASANEVALSGGYLWAAAYGSVVALDVSDPAAVLPVGRDDSSTVSLGIAAEGNRAFSADWDFITFYEATPGVVAPQAWPLALGAWFDSGGEAELRVANAGGADLHLLGLASPEPGVSFTVDRLVVPPGEVATVRATFEGAAGGAPLPDTTLCLVTDSPDAPVLELPLAAGSEVPFATLEVGDPAPDFTLPDLDGNIHTLSSYLGKPVVLISFSTWCPICIPQLLDAQETIWEPYKDEGVVVLGLGNHEEVDLSGIMKLRDQLGLTFPLLDAPEEEIAKWLAKQQYKILPYPHDFVISPEGIVVHTEGQWYPETIKALLDGFLAGDP